MNNKCLKTACIAAVICIAAVTMIGASMEPKMAEVRNLLEQRSDIISNVLAGNITFEGGKQHLKKIEEDKIYSDDIKVLSQYRDTDYNEVLGMNIVRMEKKSHIYDRLSFACTIEWTMRDYDGIYKETIQYTIGVSKADDEYKLISMEIDGVD